MYNPGCRKTFGLAARGKKRTVLFIVDSSNGLMLAKRASGLGGPSLDGRDGTMAPFSGSFQSSSRIVPPAGSRQ